jgi:hypothetical protein
MKKKHCLNYAKKEILDHNVSGNKKKLNNNQNKMLGIKSFIILCLIIKLERQKIIWIFRHLLYYYTSYKNMQKNKQGDANPLYFCKNNDSST